MARSQAADGISRLSTARRFAGSPRRTYLAGVDGAAAIDAGKNVGCPATDQRAAPRPFDGDGESVCDVGAFAVSDIVFSDGFESGDTGAWSFTSGALAPGVPEIKSPRLKPLAPREPPSVAEVIEVVLRRQEQHP